MNQLKNFTHDAFGELIVLVKEGKEYFPATDVAIKLGYSNPHDALTKHCKNDGVAFCEVTDSIGRLQQKKFINEGNLYRLIVKSRLPEAEKFEEWVFEEVLPSIRKHGAYMTPETIEKALLNPDTIINIATRLKEEQEKRQQAERVIAEQQPKVLFADTCLASDDSILVRELAKLVTDQGIKIGQNRLYDKLREWGYIIKGRTEPTQRAMDAGYFEVIQRAIQTPDGTRTSRTTKVTPKGQMRIIQRLKKETGTGVSNVYELPQHYSDVVHI